MKNADMPAIPCSRIEFFATQKDLPANQNPESYQASVSYSGLTKREDFAARFMAAHLTTLKEGQQVSFDEIAKWAIEDADALLKALENSK